LDGAKQSANRPGATSPADDGVATKTKEQGLIYSDLGSQFTSMDWASFLKHHNLEHSMSRRGNFHDNAVAESFFNLLRRERIRRRVYKTRAEARQDVFDYIEMFYNPKRKHARNGMLPPVEFERQQKMKTQGVWETRRYSVRQFIL
jgi:putative transposase